VTSNNRELRTVDEHGGEYAFTRVSNVSLAEVEEFDGLARRLFSSEKNGFLIVVSKVIDYTRGPETHYTQIRVRLTSKGKRALLPP